MTVQAIEDAGEWAGVRLGWSAGPMVVGTHLDCAGARELAERLDVAAIVAQSGPGGA